MPDDGDLRGERAARRSGPSTRTSTPLVSGAKKVDDVDTAAWPEHLKAQAPGRETWPNITEQKKPLPGADDAAKEENKIAALTLEGGG